MATKTKRKKESAVNNTDNSSVLTKGLFIRALCKKLRELIPDGEAIELETKRNSCILVDGLDLAVFLLTLTKDIPENEHMWDPRPCDGDPEFDDPDYDEFDLTCLKKYKIKLPEGW